MGVPVPASDLPVSRKVPYSDLPNPGVWDTIKEAAAGAGKNIAGIGENIANQVTQLGAMTVSAIPNIIGSAGAELADAVVNERMPTFKGIGDKFHANLEPQIYQPVTDSGKRQVEATGKVITAIPAAVDAIDEATGDTFKRNMPNTYAATQVAGEFLPWIVGGKALHNPGKPSVVPKAGGKTVPLEDLPPEQARAEAPKQEAPRQEVPPSDMPPGADTPPPDYTSKTEPSSPERTQYEIALTADPNTSKAAMMLPQVEGATAKDVISLSRQSGLQPLKEGPSFYLFNPKQTTAPELRAAIKNGTEGNLLGYGTDAVPAKGIDYAVSIDGRGTVDLPTIKQWRDNNQLGFAGRALDAEMATAKMQEMGAKQIEAPMSPTPMSERAPDAPQAPVTPLEAKVIETPAPEPIIQKEPLNIQPDVGDTPITFERLAPAVRRGAAVSYKVNMSPSQRQSLAEVRQEVSDGMAGDRVGIYNTNEPGFTNVAWGSFFPEYFQDKGLTKKEVLPVLDRIINNEAVTEKQWMMAEDLLKAKRYDTLNQVLNRRAEVQAERISGNEADWADRLQAAEDYFQQRGGFDEITAAPIGEIRANEPAGAGRVHQSPVRDNAQSETPRVETIDESGWGQQVAPELQGDKKGVQFGDKKPTGRNVGLSEFMDEFTADPQADLFSSKPTDVPKAEPIIREFKMKAADADFGTVKKLVSESHLAGEVTFNLDNGGKIVATQKGKYLHATVHYPSGKSKIFVENSKGTFTETAASHYTVNSNSHADTGGYSGRPSATRETTQTFLEQPEMLKLAKAINEGKIPKLMERMGNALGRFTHRADGEASIKLRKDLFAGPQIAAESMKTKDARTGWEAWQKFVQDAHPDTDIIFRQKFNRKTGNVDFKAYKRDPNYVLKTFAHEIGHNIDYIPDSMVRGRGNILGHIGALKKYMKHTLEMYPDAKGKALTPEDRARLAKEARAEIKDGADIVETVTREVPKYADAGVTPEMITEIWNGMGDARNLNPDLYQFIAKMSAADKKQVVVQAMKGVVHERLQGLGKRQVGTETVTETITRPGKATPEAIRRRTQQLIKEEIIKRRLYEKQVITDELKAVTQAWKPFDDAADAGYTKYRYSSAELYADATSVLFNEPQLLKDTAPTFYKAFFYHMGERPAFKEAYTAISRMSKDPQALASTRLQDRFDMYDRGDAKYNGIRNDKAGKQGIADTFFEIFSDKNHHTKQLFDDSPTGELARNRQEAIAYIPGEVSNYFLDQQTVRKGLQDKGITDNEFGAYLDLMHTIENRRDIANSLGTTEATAKTELAELKKMLGAEKFAAVEQAADKFAEIRKPLINTWLKEGIITAEQHEAYSGRGGYVRTEVQDYMDAKFGKGTAAAAGWKKMAEGTLSDKVNPYIATVLQDMSIIRMGRVNLAKVAAVDHLAPAGSAPLAQMKWNEGMKMRRPVDPPEGYANMVILRNGKPEYRVVSDFVAKTYTSEPTKARQINVVWGAVQSVFRNLFISKNVPWMVRNMMFRDPAATFKNNPEMKVTSISDRVSIYKELFKAIPDVYADVVHGKRTPELKDMYDRNMLNIERVFSEKEITWENELDRMAFEFAQGKSPSEAKIIATAKKVNQFINHLGSISDKTPKLAGKRILESKGITGEKLADRVRNTVGTPDFQVQAGGHKVFNYVGMFYEVRKASFRTMKQAFEHDPFQYITKTISANILPKLAMTAAAAGYFGDELKEAYSKVAKWDMALNNVIPLPNGFVQSLRDSGLISKGSGAYAKIPQDYEGQFFGAVTQHLIEKDAGKVLNDLFTAQPLSGHAVWGILGNAGTYLVGGKPYDTFRQRDVLTKEQQDYSRINGPFNVKGMQGMGKYIYNSTLGAALPKMDNREFPPTPQTFEKAWGMVPGLSTIIVISNGVEKNTLYDLIQKPRDAKALKSYEAGDQINDAIRSGKDKPADIAVVYKALIANKTIDPVKTRYGAFRARYLNTIMQKDYGIKPNSKAEQKTLRDFAK